MGTREGGASTAPAGLIVTRGLCTSGAEGLCWPCGLESSSESLGLSFLTWSPEPAHPSDTGDPRPVTLWATDTQGPARSAARLRPGDRGQGRVFLGPALPPPEMGPTSDLDSEERPGTAATSHPQGRAPALREAPRLGGDRLGQSGGRGFAGRVIRLRPSGKVEGCPTRLEFQINKE